MLSLLLLAFPGIFILQQLSIAFYNLYLHPLRKYPGPRLWIAFPILRYIEQCKGTFDQCMQKYHRRYGPVVRFDDRALSFATAQAWKDIYGYGHGQNQWPKVEFRAPNATSHIIFSNDADHARFRKALSHGFSEQALRLQEGLIKGYVDRLIDGIREESEAGESVDLTMWYNLTTFDIISDLAFGEPSNCLKNKAYGHYVETMFKFIKVVPYVQLANFYPTVWAVIKQLIGKKINERRQNLFKIGDETVLKRKNDPSRQGRADFMESMLNSKEVISDKELASNSHILFLAGSETTATLLTGVTYWMLKTPDTMTRAVEEVRATFKTEDEITLQSASAKLPYMLASLEEGLRMYSPVPTVLLRTVPEDATISGYAVPRATQVGVHQEGTNLAPYNFHRANEFVPERWLPESTTNEKSEFFDDKRDARQPFSVGPRNCIGRNLAFSEMRQILARVLWNFDLELVEKELDWSKQRTYALREKGPLMVRVAERKRREKDA